MTKIKPDGMFEVWRPDEVAECIDGVTDAMYRRLWEVMSFVKPIPNKEDNGPADVIGIGSVAKVWDHFTDEEKQQLNELAAAWNERE